MLAAAQQKLSISLQAVAIDGDKVERGDSVAGGGRFGKDCQALLDIGIDALAEEMGSGNRRHGILVARCAGLLHQVQALGGGAQGAEIAIEIAGAQSVEAVALSGIGGHLVIGDGAFGIAPRVIAIAE